MNSNLLIFVLLVVVSALALAASASESAVTLYSCSYSSSCRYASRCLGRYATAGRSYYFSEPVGCCMCLDPYSCYGCRNFGECSLLKSYCTAFGSYPSGISNTGKMPTWALVLAIVVPLVVIVLGVSITICCLCCACCIAWRASQRNHHEVEMIGVGPVIVQPAQVETLYYGAPTAPNAWHASPAPPVYPGHQGHFGVQVHVAPPQAASAQLYVPLAPLDDDPFY